MIKSDVKWVPPLSRNISHILGYSDKHEIDLYLNRMEISDELMKFYLKQYEEIFSPRILSKKDFCPRIW